MKSTPLATIGPVLGFDRDNTMNVTQLPFNRLIGMEPGDPEGEFLASLPDDSKYTNHLGTVHATALFALAEAGSGEFLLRHMGSGEGFVGVVRRVEGKFRKPATGSVSARASVGADVVSGWSVELERRGRVLAPVAMEVVDAGGTVALYATIEWFISRQDDK